MYAISVLKMYYAVSSQLFTLYAMGNPLHALCYKYHHGSLICTIIIYGFNGPPALIGMQWGTTMNASTVLVLVEWHKLEQDAATGTYKPMPYTLPKVVQ